MLYGERKKGHTLNRGSDVKIISLEKREHCLERMLKLHSVHLQCTRLERRLECALFLRCHLPHLSPCFSPIFPPVSPRLSFCFSFISPCVNISNAPHVALTVLTLWGKASHPPPICEGNLYHNVERVHKRRPIVTIKT